MKEVSIYIVTGIRGRWQQDGHIGYALEYYKENCKYPVVITPYTRMRTSGPYARQTSTRKTQNAKILFNICPCIKSATT